MSFTVTRPGGTKDAEFPAYARLLRQSGIDLGKLPRVPEPATNRRWLHVWTNRADAQAFADELRQRTADSAWQVVEVNGSVSEGPLGPLMIQLARQGDGLTFALHALSEALLRSAFPQAFGFTYVILGRDRWEELCQGHGSFRDWARQAALALTGLTAEQLITLGYAVIDTDTEETWAFVPPATAPQGGGESSVDGGSGGSA